MTWDHVRIELSAAEPGHADLFLMTGARVRLVENIIAHLPIFGVPSRANVSNDPDWRFMLDVLVGINERQGRGAFVMVETSNGDRWKHIDDEAMREEANGDG